GAICGKEDLDLVAALRVAAAVVQHVAIGNRSQAHLPVGRALLCQQCDVQRHARRRGIRRRRRSGGVDVARRRIGGGAGCALGVVDLWVLVLWVGLSVLALRVGILRVTFVAPGLLGVLPFPVLPRIVGVLLFRVRLPEVRLLRVLP